MENIFNFIFDSDEEEDENFAVRRPRIFRERRDYFQLFDEVDFKKRFRLSKASALFVLQQIEADLEYPSERNKSLSPMGQLLLTLRFYATGSFLKATGDFMGVSEATAHRCVHKVSRAIARLSPQHIYFPDTPQKIQETQVALYELARFPKVIGCIDCTHIRIQSPGGVDAELYRNRKGYFSLNVQTICNANLELLDIVARWPGSTHDATIFNSCNRKGLFDEGRYGDAVLLGDSGYPILPFLMTPIDAPANRPEQLFNESHIRTRNCQERLYGVWKRRFPALAMGLRVSLDNVLPMIVAMAVLFNILRRNHEDEPPEEDDLELPAPWADVLAEGDIPLAPVVEEGGNAHQRRRQGQLVRNAFVANHFARL